MKMIKVYALPYAGGSSTMYHDIEKYNNDEIKIIPIELAGRGRRFDEPLYSDFREAVNDVFKIICSNMDNEEYALFGYSMGGFLIYEVCCLLKENGFKLPVHIFIASIIAPNTRSFLKKSGVSLADSELVDFVIGMGGVPSEVVHNDVFENVFFPIIKSDLLMLYYYKATNTTTFGVNITVLYGSDDKEIVNDINDWKNYTTKQFDIVKFDGDHFFITNNAGKIFRTISEKIINL